MEDTATSVAEEYASVTISIDHLVATPHEGGHTVVKNVWSTETAAESLLAQIAYFGQTPLLAAPGVCSMIAKGQEKAAAFVYTVNEALTNVIVDAALWRQTIENVALSEGTVLGAHAAFITLAAELKRAASAEGKGSPVLAFISE